MCGEFVTRVCVCVCVCVRLCVCLLLLDYACVMWSMWTRRVLVEGSSHSQVDLRIFCASDAPMHACNPHMYPCMSIYN